MKQESNDSQSIGERVREHLPVGLVLLERRARAQWISIPTQMRSAVDDLLARIRRGLDLPSRGEVQSLLARIDDLDRKLVDLELKRAARLPAPAPAKPKRKASTKASQAKATKPRARRKASASATSAPDAEPKAKAKAKPKTKAKPKAATANKRARRDAIERAAKNKAD